jgi:small-conductance mechanosensitive channel
MVANDTLILTQHPLDFVNGLFFGVLNKLVIVLVILFTGFIIGKIIGKFVTVVIREIEIGSTIGRLLNIRFSIDEVLGNVVSYAIYLLTIVIALSYIGLAAQVVTIVAAVILIIVILHFIVGVHDQVSNTMAGLRIHRKAYFRLGKRIKVGRISGTIISSTLTDTVVKSDAGDTLYIPNRMLVESIVVEERGVTNVASKRRSRGLSGN